MVFRWGWSIGHLDVGCFLIVFSLGFKASNGKQIEEWYHQTFQVLQVRYLKFFVMVQWQYTVLVEMATRGSSPLDKRNDSRNVLPNSSQAWYIYMTCVVYFGKYIQPFLFIMIRKLLKPSQQLMKTCLFGFEIMSSASKGHGSVLLSRAMTRFSSVSTSLMTWIASFMYIEYLKCF